MFLDIAGRYTIGIQYNLTSAYFSFTSGAILLDETSLFQQDGVCQSLVTFLIGKVDGNIAANGIQLLAVT